MQVCFCSQSIIGIDYWCFSKHAHLGIFVRFYKELRDLSSRCTVLCTLQPCMVISCWWQVWILEPYGDGDSICLRKPQCCCNCTCCIPKVSPNGLKIKSFSSPTHAHARIAALLQVPSGPKIFCMYCTDTLVILTQNFLNYLRETFGQNIVLLYSSLRVFFLQKMYCTDYFLRSNYT